MLSGFPGSLVDRIYARFKYGAKCSSVHTVPCVSHTSMVGRCIDEAADEHPSPVSRHALSLDKINVHVHNAACMKVADDGTHAVYVYPESDQSHKMPHCHVRSTGAETVVALPTLDVIVGPPLTRKMMELLISSLNEICDCWDELNPEITT